MKKILTLLIVAALAFAAMIPALAQEQASNLLHVEKQTVRGNSAWTPESLPQVYLTPYFDEYIVEGKEGYPAEFVSFPIPEGSSPYAFRRDVLQTVDFDKLVSYTYQALDRASYEVFLEKAEEDNILSDGSDGLAMYVVPDKRRGCAMIDLKSMFGKTAKLTIEIYDHTGDMDGEALSALIQAETDRVREAMRHEKLDAYWSQGAFSAVTLYDDYAKHELTLDASSLTITTLNDKRMTTLEKNAQGKVEETEYELTDYLYKAEEAREAELSDGTQYQVYNSEYTGYASFRLSDGDKPLMLSIKITCDPQVFSERLEQAYSRVIASSAK